MATSRELKRLESVSRSPIFAHFQESLGGLMTIRAYKQEGRFLQENLYRMDRNLVPYYPSVVLNRWLAFRLEFLGKLCLLNRFRSIYNFCVCFSGRSHYSYYLKY